MSGHTTNLFRLIIAIVCLSAVNAVHAEVKLPAIIGDNMVLQQGVRVRIWGNAKPGERVAVTLKDKSASTVADAQGHWQVLDKSASTVADAQGHWQVWLDPLKAGGPIELTVKGDNVVTVKNVLAGEVWLC